MVSNWTWRVFMLNFACRWLWQYIWQYISIIFRPGNMINYLPFLLWVNTDIYSWCGIVLLAFTEKKVDEISLLFVGISVVVIGIVLILTWRQIFFWFDTVFKTCINPWFVIYFDANVLSTGTEEWPHLTKISCFHGSLARLQRSRYMVQKHPRPVLLANH